MCVKSTSDGNHLYFFGEGWAWDWDGGMWCSEERFVCAAERRRGVGASLPVISCGDKRTLCKTHKFYSILISFILFFCSVLFRFGSSFLYAVSCRSFSLHAHTQSKHSPHPFKLIHSSSRGGWVKSVNSFSCVSLLCRWQCLRVDGFQHRFADRARRRREAQGGAGAGRGKDRWMKAEAEAEAAAVKGTKAATTVKSDGNWLKSKEKKQPNYGIKIYIHIYVYIYWHDCLVVLLPATPCGQLSPKVGKWKRGRADQTFDYANEITSL